MINILLMITIYYLSFTIDEVSGPAPQQVQHSVRDVKNYDVNLGNDPHYSYSQCRSEWVSLDCLHEWPNDVLLIKLGITRVTSLWALSYF